MRNPWKSILLLYFCLSHAAVSAEFKRPPIPAGGSDFIEIVGDLALGDDKKFISLALSSDNATVVFHSPGGNLLVAMEIGRAIRLKGFSTLVPDNMLCASACALAWLAGRTRMMSDSGRVGFHAAYIDQGGQANVSSAGNAIVGAYLNQLGLPTPAIMYITESPPAGMQWLSFADAKRFGIDVNRLSLTPDNEFRETNAPIEALARETRTFIAASNLSTDASLEYLNGKYTDEVNYFGRLLSKSAILNDKRTFFQRWPNRNYSLQPNSLKIVCYTQTRCKSDGAVNWEASNEDSRSAGSASFAFVWTMEKEIWKLSSESTQVIARQLLPLAVAASKGSYLVQLSSQQTEEDALAAYQVIKGKFQSVLGERQPVIRRADLGDKGIFYRAAVGPFEGEQAFELCARLKSLGGQCAVHSN